MDAVKNFAYSTVASFSGPDANNSITDVQVGVISGAGTVALPAFAVNPVNGDTIVVVVSAYVNAPQTPTDSRGNTYTQLGVRNDSGLYCAIYSSENIVGGSAFVVSSPGANSHGAVAYCLHNVEPSSSTGDIVTTANAGAGSGAAGPTVIVPVANSIFIAGLIHQGGTIADGGSGWNAIANGFTSGCLTRARGDFTQAKIATQYKIASTVQTGAWTSTGQAWGAVIASFKPKSHTINVASGEGGRFPAVPFNATVWPTIVKPLPTNAEIIRVTARTSDALTISRQQESSLLRTIVTGDQIASAPTAKLFTDIFDAISILSTSPGLALLEQRTASASATLDFTTRNAAGQSGATFQSDFDTYYIEIEDIVPATNDVSFKMLCSTNGGSSYDTSGVYAKATRFVSTNNSSGLEGGSAAAFADLGGNISNTGLPSGGVHGQLRLTKPLSTTRYKHFWGDVSFLHISIGRLGWDRHLWYDNAAAVTALRFLFSAGNIASGTIRLYGLKK